MSEHTRRERILALDLLRGYSLSMILIDHFAMYPNLLDPLSGRGQLWASAAEGFFIISGLLVGYVYAPRMIANAGKAFAKLYKRAGKLYLCAVALTWAATWAGNKLLDYNLKEGLWIKPDIGEFLYKSLTLQYNYGWTDFLQYYVVYILIAPFALWLCVKHKAWLVVLVSFAVWLFRKESFVLSWQLLFMLGIVIGYYLPAIEKWFRNLTFAVKKRIVTTLTAATVITLASSALIVIASTYFVGSFSNFAQMPSFLQTLFINLDNFQRASEPWVFKWTLEPGRLVIAFLWFATMYIWFRRYEQRINAVTRGYLQTLGEASLYVYGVHGIMVFIVLVVLPGYYGFVLSSIITAAGLAVLYVFARYRNIPRQYLARLRAKA